MSEKNEWKLVRVNEAFGDLMYWLERCERKGHLENCSDLVEPWEAFDYEYVAAPENAPSAPGDAQDERQAFEAWAEDQGFVLDCDFFEVSGQYYDQDDTQLAYDIWRAARASVGAPAAGDALELTLAQKYEDACIAANANAQDAARWRAFERALRTRIAGPGHGTRIKVVTICPMYGDEKDVHDVRALIDAALAAQVPQQGEA